MGNTMKLSEIDVKKVLSFQEIKQNISLTAFQRKLPICLQFNRLIVGFSTNKKLATAMLAALIIFFLTTFLLPIHIVYAQGFALTGNFSRFGFELAPGKTSAGIEAYIIVINNNEAPVRVKIDTRTPQHVTITVPETDFMLDAGANKRLDVVVEVGKKAVPGEYEISISATPIREGEGIKISGGSAQRATLKVLKPGMSLLVIAVIVIGSLLVLAIVIWLLVIRRR